MIITTVYNKFNTQINTITSSIFGVSLREEEKEEEEEIEGIISEELDSAIYKGKCDTLCEIDTLSDIMEELIIELQTNSLNNPKTVFDQYVDFILKTFNKGFSNIQIPNNSKYYILTIDEYTNEQGKEWARAIKELKSITLTPYIIELEDLTAYFYQKLVEVYNLYCEAHNEILPKVELENNTKASAEKPNKISVNTMDLVDFRLYNRLERIEQSEIFSKKIDKWKANARGSFRECAAFCEVLYNKGFFNNTHKNDIRQTCINFAKGRYYIDLENELKGKDKQREREKNFHQTMIYQIDQVK